MKNTLLLLSLVVMSIFAFAQTPQAFKYQAVARDLNGNPVINQGISVKISILSGSPEGTVEYCELHQTNTNSLGLINLEVGRGTAVTGNFAQISWGNNASFIKTEMDLAGGDNFVFMGTSQLLSVPYALYSANGIRSMTTDERDALVSPFTGMQIYNSTSNCLNYFNGTAWFETCGQCTPLPTQAVAGEDQYFADATLSTNLQGNMPVYGTGTWTIESGNGGSFANANDPQTLFTGQLCDSYSLKWTISTACASTSDGVNISFDASPTLADAGQDVTITTEALSLNLAANTPELGVGQWTIFSGQGGTLANPGSPTTLFTGQSCTTYLLVWKIALPCYFSSDTVSVTFFTTPTPADAGEDQMHLQGTWTTLQANAPINGTGFWEIISGAGAMMVNVNDPQTIFFGQNATVYKLAWTISTLCAISVDSLSISFGVLPIVTTKLIIDISPTTATSGGNITSDGGTEVTGRGVCWSASPNPTIFNTNTINGTGTGEFTSNITDLSPNTIYYVRAYANNNQGTSYGNQLSFTTLSGIISLTTVEVTGITTTTAIGGGEITDDGGSPITVRGVCWSTSQNPSITDSTTNDGSENGGFVSNLTNLTPNTLYYVRAYATNGIGTFYGNQLSFTTPSCDISLTTTEVTEITKVSAKSGGEITNDCGLPNISRGICWSTNITPTIANSHTTNGSGTGSFTSTITNLITNTNYYVRSYATNNDFTKYGNLLSFKTIGIIDPTVVDGQFAKPYKHNVYAYAGIHDSTEANWVITKHVACEDCHNPDLANTTTAVAPFVNGFNKGVKGINQSGNPVDPVQYEYEICYRCHSGNPWSPAAVTPRVIVQNNTRLEFAPGNPSFHSVAAVGVNTSVPSLIAPWTITSRIYCSDCHASDGASSPAGPHGSTFPRILKLQYSTANNTTESAAAYALCYSCHSRTSILSDVSFKAHKIHIVTQKTPCNACHDPHGISSTQGNSINNSNLINFWTGINTPSPGNGAIRFEDQGLYRGRCFLTCHGENHDGWNYP